MQDATCSKAADFSPDVKKIVFISTRDETEYYKSDIFIMELKLEFSDSIAPSLKGTYEGAPAW